jgi:hypothetical protein
MSNKNEKNETENNQNNDSVNTSGSKSYQTLSPKDIEMIFECILPSHTEEERELLENNILNDGEIRDPLIIWKDGNKNILIDGLLRHQISLKHKLVCPVIFKEFPSSEEATLFVLDNQLGRRNLSDFSSCELVLRFEHIYKTQGRIHQSKGGKGCKISNEDRVDTKKILAERAGVSHDTLGKVKEILKQNPDTQTLTNLRQGKLKINSVHSKLTGKKTKSELIPTCLFDESGNLIPDFSTIKSLTIIPSKDGKYRVEVVLKDNQRNLYESNNLIKVTEVKPTSTPSDDQPIPTDPNPVPVVRTIYQSVDNPFESSETTTLTSPDTNRLHILYEEYDFSTITNPLWEEIRAMYIKDVLRMFRTSLPDYGKEFEYFGVDDRHPSSPFLEDVRTRFIQSVRTGNGKKKKYLSLTMDDKCEFPKFCEKLRLELLNNWEKKNQPLGGGRKSQSDIIENLKKFKDLDSMSILKSDDSGEENILSTDPNLTSGITQFFPEMMDTPTQSGKSPMDVIKDSETFMKFMERVIVADGMHQFSKSIEFKNNLKNAA